MLHLHMSIDYFEINDDLSQNQNQDANVLVSRFRVYIYIGYSHALC